MFSSRPAAEGGNPYRDTEDRIELIEEACGGSNGYGSFFKGCAHGTPDSELNILGIIGISCHADDQNGVGEPFGVQANTPYGVREALTVLFRFPPPREERGLFERSFSVKATAAASEGHTVAPPRPPDQPVTASAATTPTVAAAPGQPGQPGGKPGPDEPDGPAGGEAVTGGGDALPFTGADLLWLALLGSGLLGIGVTLRAVTEAARQT